jgi:hypothetical protein
MKKVQSMFENGSLMDSTASPKVKTTEGERVAVRSLARNTSGVEGRARVSGWGLRRLTSNSILTRISTNQTTSWLVHSWSTLVHRRTTCKHGLTRLTLAQT